jgi:hypothetical protein
MRQRLDSQNTTLTCRIYQHIRLFIEVILMLSEKITSQLLGSLEADSNSSPELYGFRVATNALQ